MEEIINNSLASNNKRFLNYIIDRAAFYGFLLFLFSIIGVVLVFIDPENTFFEDFENISTLEDVVVTTLSYIFFMFLVEVLTKGRSVGKYITGTMVVNEYGEKPSGNTFLKRNLCRLVPFNGLSFLMYERGWHDSLSYTYVVNKKQFEEAIIQLNEIKKLGLD